MKNCQNNQSVAQGAAVWNEREKHQQIMDALSKVKGYYNSYYYINGYCHYWHVDKLPEGMAEQIAERGNHEEIMYMIRQYGNTKRPAEKKFEWVISSQDDGGALLSDKVQEIILMRNVAEEIDAFTTYHGFNTHGQDIILNRGDHAEIMKYLNRHGFEVEQQRKLRQRNNKEEIDLHIRKHGWCYELLDEMFAKIDTGGGYEEYDDFIDKHEFPVPFQKRMLKTVKTPEYKAYVDRYGLWNEAHPTLIQERSEDEVLYYLQRHRYLGKEGEHELAQKRYHRLNKFYAENRVNTGYFNFLYELMKVPPLDYEAMTVLFLQLSAKESGYYNQDDFRLMTEGKHKEIMARIKESSLDSKSLSALFFRNKPSEFEAYAKKWADKHIY